MAHPSPPAPPLVPAPAASAGTFAPRPPGLVRSAERAAGRLALRGLIQAVRLLPVGHAGALALGRGLGGLLWRVAPKRRAIALRNLRIAFGDAMDDAERARVGEASFRHFGMTAIESIRFAFMPQARVDALLRVDPAAYDEFRALHAHGKGVLLVTGHVGNFEVIGRWLSARGLELMALAREAADPGTTELMIRLRARMGIRVVTRGQRLRPIYEGLARGASVAIIADQNARDVTVPFFGHPTGTFDGPARIALKSGAPMLFFSCVRDGRGGFDVRSHGHLWPAPTGERAADVARLAAAMNAHLEAIIRAYPEQWLWMHNRWRSSPAVRERFRF